MTGDNINPSMMTQPLYSGVKINVFNDCVRMFDEVARQWVRLLSSKLTRKNAFAVAISGGRSAPDLFKAMVSRTLDALSKSGRFEKLLKNVHFFWADERCVPPDDPASNYLVANQNLLQPLKVKSSNIHRIRGEISPDKAACIAGEELIGCGVHVRNGFPVVDLILLGMGEDGHVASLFPEELRCGVEMVDSDVIYRPVVASKPPPQRITMGYKTIIKAKRVWVVITGTNKQEALSNSLPPKFLTPFGIIIKHRKQTEIFYCE